MSTVIGRLQREGVPEERAHGDALATPGWRWTDEIVLLEPGETQRPPVEDVLARARAALDDLLAIDPRALDATDTRILATGVEELRRQVDAAGVEVAASVDGRRLYAGDGFFSTKAWLKHTLQLSGPEAHARVQTARMHARLGVWRSAERAGLVGVDQSRLLARVVANPRLPDDVVERDTWELLVDALDLTYDEFEAAARRWEMLADPVGSLSRAKRNHELRDVRLGQRPNGSWQLTGSFGGAQGAELNEIWAHFVEAEWETDWAEARARLGDDAEITVAGLRRTEAQRRADALLAAAVTAAGTRAGDGATPLPTVNLLIDEATYAAACNGEAQDPSRYRDVVCRTQRGHLLHPSEVVNTSLWAHVRRVVYGSARTVIELGRRARLFRGSSREAVMLLDDRCAWVGCDMPVAWCEADHSLSWRQHGATVPRNGGPLCLRHNLLKERGFRVFRDADGTWHTIRPDGTEVR